MRKKKLKSLFSGEENNDETNEGEKENGNMNKKQKKKNKYESETSLSSSTMAPKSPSGKYLRKRWRRSSTMMKQETRDHVNKWLEGNCDDLRGKRGQ